MAGEEAKEEMTRNELHELIDLVYEVQESTEATICVNLSNYSIPVTVYIADSDFDIKLHYDKTYHFDGDEHDKDKLDSCKEYLNRLLHNNSPVPDQSNGAKENKSSLS
ncbi:hypothetical protein [Murimonas intestini]|uniref:hypothetical protein n=1 Tax=Murimonas intestini TaxID=1337051 RepID=UPI00248A92E1|nr:hypothetical protein [Murimonas intestini]